MTWQKLKRGRCKRAKLLNTCLPYHLLVICMNITIRNIGREIYQEFKAEATKRNLKIGEALTLAMQELIKSEKKKKINLSILDFEPFDWGEGTETVSEDVDTILYGVD